MNILDRASDIYRTDLNTHDTKSKDPVGFQKDPKLIQTTFIGSGMSGLYIGFGLFTHA